MSMRSLISSTRPSGKRDMSTRPYAQTSYWSYGTKRGAGAPFHRRPADHTSLPPRSSRFLSFSRSRRLPLFGPQLRLRRRQTGDRHPIRRATDVVEADSMAEIDTGGIAAVLSADAHLQVGAAAASLLHAHPDQFADALLVNGLERVLLQDPFLQVNREERSDVVPAEPKGHLGE